MRTELFPAMEPFATGELPVDAIHTLYLEQCGRPDGESIVFLHGGPGAGSWPADRTFFDPEHFRIVLFDQRGCGRSRPRGELRANTTELLVEDIERVREALGIERWHVFGGSWGSTLGLCYAQTHPERCLSLVLRGIWLFRQQDLDWWLRDVGRIRPETWRAFAEFVPPDERDDLLEAYWRRLTGSDPELALAAARAWSVYEGSCCTLRPNPAFAAAFGEDALAWTLARLEAHWFRNQRFDPDTLLLDRVERIRDIPGFIVHGRYDVVCPIDGADALHRAWPEASYVVVEDAGHSSREPGIARELVLATERIRTTGRPTC
jgi:proline iminopeptidase